VALKDVRDTILSLQQLDVCSRAQPTVPDDERGD
jgi:hypothetical protein